MRYVFVNCIAAGPIDWKRSLLAEGQPAIRECAMILMNDSGMVTREMIGSSAEHFAAYSEAIASGAIVVGHSVEYHHGHLRATMMHIGTDPHDGRVATICTMLSLSGHVPKFNGKRGWPTFNEACHHFGLERAGVESAEDNARNLLRIFLSMEKLGIVPEPKIWKDRNA